VRDVLDDITRWRSAGLGVALARVVDLDGSGPCAPGAAMAVNAAGQIAGSISGGCVDAAVVDEALAVLGGRAPRVCEFGYSDEDAFAVGLTCGGTIRVFVEPLVAEPDAVGDVIELVHRLERAHEPAALATVVAGGAIGATVLLERRAPHRGTLGDPELDAAVLRDAADAIESGVSGLRTYGRHGEEHEHEVSVFIDAFAPPARMVIVGAVGVAAALVSIAKPLGFRITVTDARPVFATAERFPVADEVVVDWPDRFLANVEPRLGPRDAVCVLTHDPKFDVPAIVAALATDVGYLGAMGSRRTTEQREQRLRAVGVGDEDLCRISAPIGLDLGGRAPEEVAVSICAEIIARRNGRDAPQPLRDVSTPIH
jgi:xanthine dehydrogenase accessory factor